MPHTSSLGGRASDPELTQK